MDPLVSLVSPQQLAQDKDSNSQAAPPHANADTQTLPPAGKPWHGAHHQPPRFDYAAVQTDSGVRDVLRALLVDGLVLIDGVEDPGKRETVWRLVERLFAPGTQTTTPFWRARGVTHGVHRANFTCRGYELQTTNSNSNFEI